MFLLKRASILSLVFCFLGSLSAVAADQDAIRLNATVLVASNQGSDFDLDNDAFRDQLIELFSYSAYKQIDVEALNLPRSERVKLALPEGYELVLTLQEETKDRIDVQALVRKGGKQYVYTVLSLQQPGTVFLGGPPLQDGADLIIILESTGN